MKKTPTFVFPSCVNLNKSMTLRSLMTSQEGIQGKQRPELIKTCQGKLTTS